MSERFLTSKKKRLLLYRKYDGKCANCGTDLPDNWHADHVVPHSKGGETTLQQMQPLCPSCNLTKSDSMPSVSTSNQRTFSQQNSLLNWDAFRKGQREAVRTAVEAYRKGEQWAAIVLPTRYGKTDVSRCVAYYLWKKGRIDAAIMLEPSRPIVEQVCDASNWEEPVQRYGLYPSEEIKIRELETTTDLQDPRPNGEWFLGITTQLFHQAYSGLKKWVQNRNVLLVVDECHNTSETNEWGTTVQEFANDGGIVMSMTATANRSDNEGIPGFESSFLKEDEGTQSVPKSADEEDKMIIQVYNSVRGRYQIIPDHETTFADAWDEEVLCDVGHNTFDVELEPLDSTDASDYNYLSELPAYLADENLGSIVREQPVVKCGVDRLTSIQQSWLKKDSRVQSIVFCASDRPGQSADYHAKMIEREISKQAPSLDIVKATNKGSREIRGTLKEFSDGQHDVLISKMAAGEGMDFPNAKVLLDLSPVRTYNPWVQRVMRIATRTDWANTSCLITPEDIKSIALYEMLVRESGGASDLDDPINLLGTTRLEEKVDEYEVEIEEDDEENGYIAEDTEHGSFTDNKHNKAKAEMWEPSRNLIEGLNLHGEFTEAEVATTLSSKGLRIVEENKPEQETREHDSAGVQNTTSEAKDLKREIKALSGHTSKDKREDWPLISLWIEVHHDGDYRKWGDVAEEVWNQVRKEADEYLDPGAPWSLNEMENLDGLKVIKRTVKAFRNQYIDRL